MVTFTTHRCNAGAEADQTFGYRYFIFRVINGVINSGFLYD